MTDATARRLVAGFVFVVLAISGARIAVADMFPGLPDVYKFQEMPYPCQTDQDCPPSPLYHCVSNQCHLGPLPMFLNYVGPSTKQWGGNCYELAPFHAFQTKMAYDLDIVNGRPGGAHLWSPLEYDRSLHLSFEPLYLCARGASVYDFVNKLGFVEYCIQDFQGGHPRTDQKCGYYDEHRNMDVWSLPTPEFLECSEFQRMYQNVMSYRAAGHEVQEVDELIWGHWLNLQMLAEVLVNFGPFATDIYWPVNLQLDPDGYLQCDQQEFIGHVVAVVGYDFTDPSRPTFWVQNSHGYNEPLHKISFYDWSSECNFGTKNTYFTSVRTPALWDPNPDPGDPRHPFLEFEIEPDMDLDGVYDVDDDDIDGDTVYNRWDCDPYNPYLKTDLDRDGKCDNQFRAAWDGLDAVCSNYCEGVAERFGAPGYIHVCKRRCTNWDRCMTLKIKNVEDTAVPCRWRCLRNYPSAPPGWVLPPENLPPFWPDFWPHEYEPRPLPTVCDLTDQSRYYVCCHPAQEARILECESLYKNFSNSDQDDDGIADVCEDEPVVSGLEFYREGYWTMEQIVEQGQYGPQLALTCYRAGATLEFWLFGTAQWEYNSHPNYLVSRGTWGSRLGDIGACGCSNGGWGTCHHGTCPEDVEFLSNGWPDWAWDPIQSVNCTALENAFPEDPTRCTSKILHYHRDEFSAAPPQVVGPYYELQWLWREHADWPMWTPHDLWRKIVKVKVGWREWGVWWDNTMTISDASIFMGPESCTPTAISLDWASVRFRNSPRYMRQQVLPGPGSTGLALMHDADKGDLWLAGFGKGLKGPLWASRATYPAGPSEGIQSRQYSTELAKLSPSLWGQEGEPEAVLFLMEVKREPVNGMGYWNRLWVGLVSRHQTPFYLASDLLGSVGVQPPAMKDPRLAFDTLHGSLLLAGGGHQGKASVWSLSPGNGSWSLVTPILPSDLTGFSAIMDPLTHSLLVFGGRSKGQETNDLLMVSLTSRRVNALPIDAPTGLARADHAAIVDFYKRKLYVYGGRKETAVLGDLWAIDMDNWQSEQLYDESDPTGPPAREGAGLVIEPRFDRLWVTGGKDDSGPKDLTRWAFSPSVGTWQEHRPVTRTEGQPPSGTIGWGQTIVQNVTLDSTMPYPGELRILTLSSPEPCLGIRISDALGEELATALTCQSASRKVAFWGQPGETYVAEIVPLQGFDRQQQASFELEVAPGQFVEMWDRQGNWRPVALEVDSRHGGDVGLLLGHGKLKTYDLADPQFPLLLATERVGFLARALALAGGVALVARMGPGSDLLLVDINEPAAPTATDGVSFVGPGRRVSSWGGKAYAAGVARVNIVELAGPAGPEVIGHFSPGGVVTALKAHGRRLLVTSGGKLRLYSLQGEGSPQFLSETDLEKVGAAIAVHGNTVHVAEMRFADWTKCMLGLRCNRQGPGEVFVIDPDGLLQKVASYIACSRSLPYLRWSGSHALAIERKGVVGLRADPVQ